MLNQLQEPFTGCWMETAIETCNKYKLEIHNIIKEEKEKFKQEVIKKINTRLDEEIKQLAKKKD